MVTLDFWYCDFDHLYPQASNYIEDQYKSEQVHGDDGELDTQDGPDEASVTNLGRHFGEGTQANLHQDGTTL